MTPSERDAALFHFAFTALVLMVLALPISLGLRITSVVLAYNVLLPTVARVRGHREWSDLWLFLVPLSAFQILPDAVLSSVFGVLVFPDLGIPQIYGVSAFMAGMWTIPLFVIVFFARSVETRAGRRTALAAAAAASFVIFTASEATLWRLQIWHAQDVRMIGHVALYIIVPEILLGLVTFHAYETSGNSGSRRLRAAFCVSAFYLGTAGFSYLLTEAGAVS